MVQQFTNRQEIAGLPALSVVVFLADGDADVSLLSIRGWFHLNDQEAWDVARRLEDEGYIESPSDDAEDWVKTPIAREIARAQQKFELSDAERGQLILALVRGISELNVSPATAHRVRALTLIGATIDGADWSPPLVEALVEISPVAAVCAIQVEIESLAADYADRHSEDTALERDAHGRSVGLIKETLLSIDERLSLRFVMN